MKVRNKILILICSICLLNLGQLKAQDEVSQRSYDFLNWRVLFQMNGPNNWNAALNFVKPVNNRWALRFGINPIINFNRTIGDNPNQDFYSSYHSKLKNSKLGAEISLGGEFHLLEKGKLDPYIFFGTGIGGFVEISKRDRGYTLTNPESDGLTDFESSELNKSAPQLTIKPFGGFGLNYFFHPRVAFGIEYSLSPSMLLIKGTGKTKVETEWFYEDGTVEVEIVEDENKANAFYVNLSQQIGFHLIYILKSKAK